MFLPGSSSSDSDDENMEIFLNKDKCRKKPRVLNLIETVIYAYNNEEFK